PVLPTIPPSVRFGPYVPFGPDGAGVVKRLYLTLAWDTIAMPLTISGINQNANATVTTSSPHGLVTGQKVDIFGFNNMVQVIGGPYTITVTGATTFQIGVDSTGFTAYGGATLLSINAPLEFDCTLKIDEQAVQGQINVNTTLGQSFILSVRAVSP